MRCDRCGREAVHVQPYSGLRLCGEHLAASLEARAKGMIRARGWIRPGDRIAVGLSGGPGSSSLLRFLSDQFGMRRDLSLVAITVDEGSPGMDRVSGIAGGMGIEWAAGPLSGEEGDPAGPAPARDAGEDPASRHSRLRDRSLVSLARQAGATKLALGTSLDDEAGAVFLRVIRGEPARLLGLEEDSGGVPVIRPLSRIPRDELILYARLKGIAHIPEGGGPGIPGDLRTEARRMLAEYTSRHPSALFSLANLGVALAGCERSGRGYTGRRRDPASPPHEGRSDRVTARD